MYQTSVSCHVFAVCPCINNLVELFFCSKCIRLLHTANKFIKTISQIEHPDPGTKYPKIPTYSARNRVWIQQCISNIQISVCPASKTTCQDLVCNIHALNDRKFIVLLLKFIVAIDVFKYPNMACNFNVF